MQKAIERWRWDGRVYDRLIDLCTRIARDSRHTEEVRIAADALVGALMRQREQSQTGKK